MISLVPVVIRPLSQPVSFINCARRSLHTGYFIKDGCNVLRQQTRGYAARAHGSATILPRIVLCDHLEVWAEKKALNMFNGIAELVWLDTDTTRDDFLSSMRPGGPLERTAGLYRRNISTSAIGPFDRELIGSLPRSVRWIASNGDGYDQVDVAACKEKGVFLSNTSDDSILTNLVAISLTSEFHRLWKTERDICSSGSNTPELISSTHDLPARTFAILCSRTVGVPLARAMHAFPMRVLYHSPRKVVSAPEWFEYYGAERLDDMLAQADVLSVHEPFTERAGRLVDEAMIRKLKKGAVLLNTAKRKLVDEEAMTRALDDGHLSAVGLDILWHQPHANSCWFFKPNVIHIPLLAAAVHDTRKEMEIRALTNLRDFLTKGIRRDLVSEFNGCIADA
ncbi:NAD(P)-binding protein [Laetiporus sulphureus 93-53]|uniref:NAD(P)-binding protein n=1 Tax=Laetiporus sulphureus 93-53 TaxID=1314785 RepID=A0A165DR97_9APHY|nr:NAD(P)-binding protein [Laetiporus sulphureus 93-53]KZT05461.1 NAD(P)-binding protein [Laetiporus sulphureus 93-53]